MAAELPSNELMGEIASQHFALSKRKDVADDGANVGSPHDTVYSRQPIGRAGAVRISLADGLMVDFDLENHGEIVDLFVGEEVDLLLVSSAFGPRAAEQVAVSSDEIHVPVTLPRTGILAADVASIERLLTIPLRSSLKRRLITRLVLAAVRLSELGFDVSELLRYHLSRLASLLEADRSETLRIARRDDRLTAALNAGIDFLDPLDDEWMWFSEILEDLPDESLQLLQDLHNAPLVYREATVGGTGRVADTHIGYYCEQASLSGSAFSQETHDYSDALRSPSRGYRSTRTRQDLPFWTFPILWKLIDTASCPVDDAFDGAVRLSRQASDGRMAEIRVDCFGEQSKKPALVGRIIRDGDIVSVSALLADDLGWRGSISLPSDFSDDTYHVEVADSSVRELVSDPRLEECRQWIMLARALDLADQDSHYSWQKVRSYSA